MKDGFDVVNDVRSLINLPAVTGQINGKIWPDIRPNNSKKTDIVINCNSISNSVDQIGFGNVNIYVPTITETVDGVQWTKPDHYRLNSLCKLIAPYIDAQWRETFRTEVEDSGNIFQDTDGSWFVNIGFKYYSLQSNYQNI